MFIVFFIVSLNCKISNTSNFQLPKSTKYLIMGHSHPEGAFNDSLICNAKNLSQSGELYFYTYLKIKKLVIENKQLESIFIEFTNNQITIDMESWLTDEKQLICRIPKYMPIMNFEDFVYIFPKNSFGFIKTIPLVLKNNIIIATHPQLNLIEANDWGKYFYNKRSYIDSLITAKKSGKLKITDVSKVTFENVKYLFKIIDFCKKNNVKVYLIRSPLHHEYTGISNEKPFQRILKSNFKNVTFFDFKDFPLLDEDFGDFDHLNYKGAKKFSTFFNDLLQKGLLTKSNKQQFIYQQMFKNSTDKKIEFRID